MIAQPAVTMDGCLHLVGSYYGENESLRNANPAMIEGAYSLIEGFSLNATARLFIASEMKEAAN